MTKNSVRILGLKNCATCRKALKTLNSDGISACLQDVRADPLSAGEITRFLGLFGEDLVNRRSTTWRNLDEISRGLAAEILLARHPSLMKRPLFVVGNRAYLGWSEEFRCELASIAG